MGERNTCRITYGSVCALFRRCDGLPERREKCNRGEVLWSARSDDSERETELDGKEFRVLVSSQYGNLAKCLARIFRGGLHREIFLDSRHRYLLVFGRNKDSVRTCGRGGNRGIIQGKKSQETEVFARREVYEIYRADDGAGFCGRIFLLVARTTEFVLCGFSVV